MSKFTLKEFTIADLVQAESEIGSEILGVAPEGKMHTFYLDEHGDYYYIDARIVSKSNQEIIGHRYINDPVNHQVIHIVNGGDHEVLRGENLRRFFAIVREYHKRVLKEKYGIQPPIYPATADVGLAA